MRIVHIPLAVTIFVASCGGGTTPNSTCVPGSSIACVGSGGCTGGQVCKSDGSGFSSCDCVPLPDGGLDAGSDVADTSVPIDAGDDAMACADGGLGGVGVPAMTKATASAVYQTYTPDQLIDGNPSTFWSPGGSQGWVQLDFPQPVAMNGIRMIAEASPGEMQDITVTIAGTNTVIGSATRLVPYPHGPLAAIAITPASYAGIRIAMKGYSSWVQPYEVSILTMSCP